MKNLKKILFYSLALLAVIPLTARHKQEIRLSNQYGQDVLVHMKWKMHSWPHTERLTDLILKSTREDFLLKAPISGYKLVSIDVTPAVNLSSLLAGYAIKPFLPEVTTLEGVVANALVQGASHGIAYGITHSLNSYSKKSDDTFFIIKAKNKKSAIESQKQIFINSYKDGAKYKKAIGKAETIEVPDTTPMN